MSNINIAIDGPAGAGKSTIAKAIAQKLDMIYLDTGAMYRGIAYKAIKNKISPTDENKVLPMLENTELRIKYDEDGQHVLVDDEDVTLFIRTPEISRGASDISAIPAVRDKLVEVQREIAANNNVIMDGRDIGSYVLPNANYKFYVTAKPEERARRRFNELKEKETLGNKTLHDILEDIITRDKNDSTRAFAPLKKVDDAIEIDTTEMTIAESIQSVINIVKKA